MPNNGGSSAAISGGSLKAGYTTGGAIANLMAGNIKQGVNIGGVVGTLKSMYTTSWSLASGRCTTIKTGILPFRPVLVIVSSTGSNYPTSPSHTCVVRDRLGMNNTFIGERPGESFNVTFSDNSVSIYVCQTSYAPPSQPSRSWEIEVYGII